MSTRQSSYDEVDASSSDDEELNEALESLSRTQMLEINAAFESLGKQEEQVQKKQSGSRPSKRRRTQSPQAAGGFLLDDEQDGTGGGTGGGFIPEDNDVAGTSGGGFFAEGEDDDTAPVIQPGKKQAPPKRKTVPLTAISDILDSLDLEGEDPSIMSIFENAASTDRSSGLAVVSRKDFLKVVAILVAQRDEEEENVRPRASKLVKSGGGRRRAIRLDVDEDGDQGDHDDSDPLVLSSDEEDEEEDDFHVNNDEDSDPWADEDDLDGAFGRGREPSPPSTRRATRSTQTSSAAKGKGRQRMNTLPPSSSPEPSSKRGASKGKSKDASSRASKQTKDYKLTSDQKEEAKRMFNQFFPTNDVSKNVNGIGFKEIRYVATLLNEKVSDADVDEMLEFAAGGRGKNVSLDAFSRIMLDTKTV